MLVETAVLGKIDIDEGGVLHFPDGLYGFEGKGDYALITREDEDITLMWLQALDSPAPCFVVFNPAEIAEGYAPKLENTDLRQLEVGSEDELSFLAIAVVPEDISQISVNLKSPIAINSRIKKARQVILSGQDYPIKYYLFTEDGKPPR